MKHFFFVHDGEGDGFLFLKMKCSPKKMVVRDLYHLP